MAPKNSSVDLSIDVDGLPPENVAATLAREIKALGHVDIVPVGPAEAPVWLASIPERRRVEDLTEQLDARLPAPRSLVQEVALVGLDSCVDYVDRFRDPARSVVFLEHWQTLGGKVPSVVAVLDYHASPNKPGWCRHVARMSLTFSRPFMAWCQPFYLGQVG